MCRKRLNILQTIASRLSKLLLSPRNVSALKQRNLIKVIAQNVGLFFGGFCLRETQS